MFISVYFLLVWGAALYLCSQNKNYMGQKEDIEKTENKIIFIREQRVILDRDVAELYGVETRRINEALKNNPEKFPDGYVIELTDKEKQYVVENFDHLEKLKYSHVPKGITPSRHPLERQNYNFFVGNYKFLGGKL